MTLNGPEANAGKVRVVGLPEIKEGLRTISSFVVGAARLGTLEQHPAGARFIAESPELNALAEWYKQSGEKITENLLALPENLKSGHVSPEDAGRQIIETAADCMSYIPHAEVSS